MIVGSLASLFEGGGICGANDGGSVAFATGHSPSHGLRRASPLKEGAKGRCEKRRKIYYEGYRNCSSGGGMRYFRANRLKGA